MYLSLLALFVSKLVVHKLLVSANAEMINKIVELAKLGLYNYGGVKLCSISASFSQQSCKI